MFDLPPGAVLLGGAVVVTLVLAYWAWRGETRAFKEYEARVHAEARAQAAEALARAQAQELKTLNHRNRLFAQELKAQDPNAQPRWSTSETRVWPGAKPSPVLWRPGREVVEVDTW